MMILRTSKTSPFARKALIAASIAGLEDEIEPVAADFMDPDDPLLAENPLGKLPALLLETGDCLYDSRVICEYLDTRAGKVGLFPEGDALWPALRLQALADGICDAAVLQVYETRLRPPEYYCQPWVDRHHAKAERAIEALGANPPVWSGRPTIGDVALACALGQQDLRFEGKWRRHKALADWLDRFAADVPAFARTDPTQ